MPRIHCSDYGTALAQLVEAQVWTAVAGPLRPFGLLQSSVHFAHSKLSFASPLVIQRAA